MPAVKPPATVAVTGASGFIGSHIVLTLLEDGYDVVAVVRNPDDPLKTGHLSEAKGTHSGNLTFKSGDLLKQGSFDDAFAGVDAVIHTAAVVQMFAKDGQKEIIDPSVKGTQNIIDAINKSGTVKRLVHTSSVAAVMRYDRPDYTFTEKDEAIWSSVANGDFYGVAKLEAERLVRRAAQGKPWDVSIMNPGLVLGPCLTKAHTKATPVFLRHMLLGTKQPDIFSTPVDVRDVARAHVNALQIPEAGGGERFILAKDDEATHFSKLAKKLKAVVPEWKVFPGAFRSNTEILLMKAAIPALLVIVAILLAVYNIGPSWTPAVPAVLAVLAHLKIRGSLFERSILGAEIRFNTSKSRDILKVDYRPLDETLKNTVTSMEPFVPLKPVSKKKD